ncbi:phosphonate metabolism protein/1,5-bisphosphokinase (PRPP-forming) PhnN [Pseudomonas sp. MOB-449]|nr:phosphonate metabolism protein/1,5-bisphosphokinase (PRPP-forming) PhnN [Pseudomonas sp. MOB-449]
MNGRLIYLIGPSGSGKDSLLDAVREAGGEQGCRVARRVITRSAEARGELAEAVSAEVFAEREARGEFAMSWFANGLAYGIPCVIDDWLAAGDDVLVNGSRGYLPEARRRYPHLLAVLLTVDDQVLRRRLHARGRESAEEIEARLARNTGFADTLLAGENPDLCLLDNSGSIAETCQRLLQLIENHRPVAWPDSA